MPYLGHRKPARKHWKADAPKTIHCLGHFLRKWARRGRYSQWRSLSDHVERIFFQKNWREYWQHLVSTGQRYVPRSRSYTRCFASCEYRIISHRADVVWPPRSCDLTPLLYYLWDAVKDNGYPDKPERIDTLKDNFREAIGEIQLHTIDNDLDLDRSCRPRQSFEWNYFPLLTGRIVLSNKKIFSSFLKHFPKKKKGIWWISRSSEPS